MIQFSVDDLHTPDSLERVLRQFVSALDDVSKPQPFSIPKIDLSALSSAIAPLIRDQLQATGAAPLNLQSLLPVALTGIPIVDTHSNRSTLYPPSNYAVGQLYYETDRTVWYVVTSVSGSLTWTYAGGIHDDTLSNIVADLSTADAGFLFEVTDYDHVLQWSGAGWQWGPGEVGSGYYQLYEAAPNSTGANTWQICDGSTVARLNSDGTTTNVTVPDVSTPAYLKGGTASAAVAAASGATGSTTATNQATTATNQTTDLAPTTDKFTLDAGGSTAVTGFTNPHGHTQNSHNHTQDAHTHTPGTLDLRNKQARLYFRR